jgi:hypothetical protein
MSANGAPARRLRRGKRPRLGERIGGSDKKGFVIYYLKGGEYDKVLNGKYPVSGKNADGSLRVGEVRKAQRSGPALTRRPAESGPSR